MDQFLVPQFIDVEDKVIGPVTVRQFIIMLVVGLMIFITFKLADFTLFAVLGLLEFAIGGTIAFLRINGQPFHFFLLNVLETGRNPRRRVWNKAMSDADLRMHMAEVPLPPPEQHVHKPMISRSRLKEISLIVDTGGVYTPDEPR